MEQEKKTSGAAVFSTQEVMIRCKQQEGAYSIASAESKNKGVTGQRRWSIGLFKPRPGERVPLLQYEVRSSSFSS